MQFGCAKGGNITWTTFLGQELIEEKAFCARRDPEDRDQQAAKQKDLKQAELDPGHRCIPGKRNTGGIDSTDEEKDCRGQTQDRCQNCNQVLIDLEPAQKAPDKIALQNSGKYDPDGRQCHKRNESDTLSVETRFKAA